MHKPAAKLTEAPAKEFKNIEDAIADNSIKHEAGLRIDTNSNEVRHSEEDEDLSAGYLDGNDGGDDDLFSNQSH